MRQACQNTTQDIRAESKRTARNEVDGFKSVMIQIWQLTCTRSWFTLSGTKSISIATCTNQEAWEPRQQTGSGRALTKILSIGLTVTSASLQGYLRETPLLADWHNLSSHHTQSEGKPNQFNDFLLKRMKCHFHKTTTVLSRIVTQVFSSFC